VGLCLARASYDLGERAEALEILMHTMHQMASAVPDAFSLPFLPPVRTFDERDVRGSPLEWLSASLIEGYETWRAFSSYFCADSSAVLRAHMSNPNLSTAMHRRFVLHARRVGIEVQVAADDAVTRHSADNLNPEIWSDFIRSRQNASVALVHAQGMQTEHDSI
jgi:hypothetical protein